MKYPVTQNGKVIRYVEERETYVKAYVRNSKKPSQYSKGDSLWMRFKKWTWSILRTPFIYSMCCLILVVYVTAAFWAGALWRIYNPMPLAEAQTIQNALIGTSTPATVTNSSEDEINRIGFAETRLNQFCDSDAIAHRYCSASEEGEVLMTTNKNGSVDIGKFAINNAAWGAEAVRLGYNIYTEQGNHDMAVWIAKNAGVKQWYSSEAKWK